MADSESSESNRARPVNGRAQAQQWVNELLGDCRREICFVGSEIDLLLDDPSAVEIIKNKLIQNPRIQLRLLVDDTLSSIRRSHRLLPLIQKLTSSIEVRLTPSRYQQPAYLALIVDETGYLRCLNNQRYQGRAASHAPLESRELRANFERIWDEATPDQTTRRLTL